MPSPIPMKLVAMLLISGLAAGATTAAPPAPRPPPTAAPPTASSWQGMSPGQLEAHLERLVQQLTVPRQRRAAWSEIIAIGRAAWPVLSRHFKDDSFTIRWEMANIQGSIRDERAAQLLVENVIHDENPHVRWRTLWAINEYPDRTPFRDLLRVAVKSDDETTRWNAAVGLSMVDDLSVLPLIHAGVSQADSWRRWEAINALGRIHDETSAKVLEPVVLGPSARRERHEAVLSLGKVGGPAAVGTLIRALDDPSPQVRWRAAMALATAGGRKAIAPLTLLKARETDPDVRRHVDAALESLAGR